MGELVCYLDQGNDNPNSYFTSTFSVLCAISTALYFPTEHWFYSGLFLRRITPLGHSQSVILVTTNCLATFSNTHCPISPGAVTTKATTHLLVWKLVQGSKNPALGDQVYCLASKSVAVGSRSGNWAISSQQYISIVRNGEGREITIHNYKQGSSVHQGYPRFYISSSRAIKGPPITATIQPLNSLISIYLDF